MYPPNQPNLRDSKVDMLTTKNNDMRQRRIVNAAPAVDPNDYVILDQLNQIDTQVSKNLAQALVGLANSFQTGFTTIKNIITSKLSAMVDSVNGIVFTKTDRQTVVVNVDTLNSRLGVNGAIYSTKADPNLPTVPFIRMQYDPTGLGGYFGDIVAYQPSPQAYLPLSLRGTSVTVGVLGGKLAFYNEDASTAAFKQILNGYAPVVTNNYGGIATGIAGSPYAQVNDLNNLRIAYENLRLMCDDMRNKLRTSTIVG